MEEKKVLTILLGSPRKGGNSETLAEALAAGAASKGYEVRKRRLAGMKLTGCVDCRGCWGRGEPCMLDDDMGKLYEDIEAASVVALVSPLYYYTWSAQIKPVIDRMQPYNAEGAPRGVKGKRVLLLSASGDEEAEVFDGLLAAYRRTIDFLKWENAGEICAPGIYKMGEMEEKGQRWLEEARALGERL